MGQPSCSARTLPRTYRNTAWTAETTVRLLEISGIEALRQSTMIYEPSGFAYEIYFRCTGFLPVVTFVVALLALPGCSWRSRLIGLSLGVPLILGVNFARLVHLFYLGVYRPDLFPFAHAVLWESGIVITVAVVWLMWAAWAGRPATGAPREAPA